MKMKELIEEFIKFNYPAKSEIFCGDSLKYLKNFDLIITFLPYISKANFSYKVAS
jgi:hypothetical protein